MSRSVARSLRRGLSRTDRSITRTLSFYSKWLAEVVRQPSLMVSLVIGPFLLLLAFGEGVKLGAPLPKTVLVMPEGADQRMAPVTDELSQYLDIVGQTTSLEDARRQLVVGDADLVAVIPRDPAEYVRRKEHAPITILTNEIDPVRKSYARTYIREQVALLNQQTLEKAIGDAQASIGETRRFVAQAREYVKLARGAQGDLDRTRRQVRDLKSVITPLSDTVNQTNLAVQGASLVIPGFGREGAQQAGRLADTVNGLRRNVDQIDAQLNPASGQGTLPSEADLARIDTDLTRIDSTLTEAATIPSEVLSAPFKLELENVSPLVPSYIDFYAPAVLALLIQHLAITLGALSMARIRLLGLMELLRTSPVRPSEVVTGNYLSYGSLCAMAAALLVALLTFGLKVPVQGSWFAFAGMLGLVIVSSLGIGFVVSMISSSEQQAAQIAMLVLIGSVFFSGFLVPQDTLSFPISGLSYLFPATYAIRTLQDVMLRGVLRSRFDTIDLGPVAPYSDFVILGLVSLALFAFTIYLFRREFRPD